MNRRRTLIGVATLVFGASGFVASGAFSTGSQGSLGDNWIQVAGTDQAVSFESPQQIDAGDGSDGTGGGEGDGTDNEETDTDGEDQPNGGTDEPADEQTDTNEDTQDTTGDGTAGGGGGDGDTGGDGTVTTRVQVVTNPDNPGNAVNGSGSASWNGTVIPDSSVRGTPEGFFRGVTAENVNSDATSTIGRLTNGYPNGEVAFIIANVGPAESANPTGAVSLTATLFADGDVLETDQLRFPYRVVDTSGATVARGRNLFSAAGVTLADGHVIEVVILVDTNSGDDALEQIETIQFTATGVGS